MHTKREEVGGRKENVKSVWVEEKDRVGVGVDGRKREWQREGKRLEIESFSIALAFFFLLQLCLQKKSVLIKLVISGILLHKEL